MRYEIRTRKENTVIGTYDYYWSASDTFEVQKFTRTTHYIADKDWRSREECRDGLIDLSAFGLTPIEDHFLHTSERDDIAQSSLLVSYTESPLKGEQDLQVPGRKIGAYLRGFYPHLSSDEITTLSSRITSAVRQMELLFAYDAEEIRHVYVNGPDSCMSHGSSHYDLPRGEHPAMAYAGPDLAVAYMERNEEIIARCVVWPERKIWTRIYGDYEKMKYALDAAGYTQGSLEGARVTPIKATPRDRSGREGTYYLLPYMDTCGGAGMVDGFWVLGKGSYSGGTQGWTYVRNYICVISEETVPEYDLVATTEGFIKTSFDTPEHIWSAPNDTRYLRSRVTEWIDSSIGKVPAPYAFAYMIKCSVTNVWCVADDLIRVPGYGHVRIDIAVRDFARCTFSGQLMPLSELSPLPNGGHIANVHLARINSLTERMAA